ncbi:MAG: hypothetical protein F4X51_21745 [Gemmatimonadetes bacterium]|nr:hypothetical protein [Gemmatimonadota bacterium]
MSIDLDRERLSQTRMLEWLQRDLKMTEMVTVYLSDHRESHNYGIYCALIPSAQIEQILSNPSWDFLVGTGMPGTVEYYEGGEKIVEYLRYGSTDGIEPLIIDRSFYELRNGYREISEEFRLFHNLYHDRKTDKYIKIDDEGNEYTVAVVEPDCVKIRLREIRQFLAIKEMYLSIQFDCIENSEYDLQELGLEQGESEYQKGLMRWCHNYCNDSSRNRRSFSILSGKRIVEPLPKSKSGLWGFAEEPEKKHAEFIIGVDENGNEIIHTSNPNALANNFGANPDAPHFLTPVHFRKQVLEKYYQEPIKYTIEDSLLHCGGLWCMWIDNNHDDKVCAWLGDLGRDLPYTEQLHWRSYNIPPEGGVSKTYFKRQILNQSADSDRPEHLFRIRYHELQKVCKESLGWQLLLPLGTGDEYHFQGLRIPATDEQSDFDALVLSLTKILIDSLNERRLNTLISKDQKAKLKGSIARLEAVLSAHHVEGVAERIAFLRKLQSLRSSSAAHRKGNKYRKIARDFGVESQHLRDVFTGIIWRALDVLDYFIFLVRSSSINPEIIEKNKIEEGYAILDEMVGFAKSDRTDGSVNHDESIYELRSKP